MNRKWCFAPLFKIDREHMRDGRMRRQKVDDALLGYPIDLCVGKALAQIVESQKGLDHIANGRSPNN
jgi:hypothetical protein